MKWMVRIVISVLILTAVVLAAVLLPAHFQVRSVAPPLPENSELLALRGANSPNKVSYIITSSQPLERGQISHISIVIEWANGKRFLIDTGMSRREAKNFADLLKKLDSSELQAAKHSRLSSVVLH